VYQGTLVPGQLTLSDIREIASGPVQMELDPESYQVIERAHRTVLDVVAAHKTVYGINTGFGKLASTRISDEDLSRLQENLVRSHTAGVGPPLPDEAVRLVLSLKINSLARGYSGVRPATIAMLLTLLNADALPVIPAKGSVGASGDLAPLAHMAQTLLGEGQIKWQDRIQPAREVLEALELAPLKLAPKEGLALLNGTQVSTALALTGLIRAERLLAAALVVGAMAVDAAKGTDTPFDPRIHEIRGYAGQAECAAALRWLLNGSEIRASHRECSRVQDPYSLRCQPQVLGACLDALRYAARTFTTEANAVSDNPLVFADTGEILSGGNFHAEPVALAADGLALALAEIGALAERQIALLIDHNLSDLPPFLVEHSGLNSGYMIPQVTAAALVSENRLLAHPASVDSLPTSANQEDHVSMAPVAAWRLLQMADNTADILAIAYLCAAQGIDLRAPLKTSLPLQRALALLRARVPFYDRDRPHAPDIAAARAIIISGAMCTVLERDTLL